MFDIAIGTLIPAHDAPAMIPQLNPHGFETYELNFSKKRPLDTDMPALIQQVTEVLDGRAVSALSYYANPLADSRDAEEIACLIESAPKFGCSTLGVFAGGIPEKTIPQQIPDFKAVWGPLADYAASRGVKIGFEGCGRGWNGGSTNIAYCAEAWELMFDAVPSDALGLEWEPCHALEALGDPIVQLRKWAKKVVHLHGKDGTIAWDVVREFGINGVHPYVWDRTPGFGDTNWADVFTILLQNGFSGACDIEGYHDPVHYWDMEWTAQETAVEYLKRCRGGIAFWEGPNEYRGYQGPRRFGSGGTVK